MNLRLWIRQTLAVMKMELQRYVLGHRWIGVYLFAFAPVAMLLFVALVGGRVQLNVLTTRYAIYYQTFALRLSIFLSSAMVFSQLFRGEVLEKTLHFYLLAPVRREVLMAGKYLAGVVMMGSIFGLSTMLTNIIVYLPAREFSSFFLEGSGMTNLARYILVTVMACVAYGGIFTLIGTLFKNPAGPAILIAGWEAFYFILPASLQSFTVMHYLQSMLPVGIDLGAFAVVVDPTPAILGIPLLVMLAGIMVWVAGQVLRRAQVTYSSD